MNSFFYRADLKTGRVAGFGGDPVSSETAALLVESMERSGTETLGEVDLSLPEGLFRLWILRQENRAWLYGIKADVLLDAGAIQALARLASVFLEKEDPAYEPVTSRHFEEIQKLNNEVVNSKRRLAQANGQLKRLNSKLSSRLSHDPLTGLLNKYQYQEEIESLVRRQPEAKGIFAFMDIDNFKGINDTWGHAAGDAYLVEFARRLARVTWGETLHLRIAGDEFGLYCHGLDALNGETLHALYGKLEKELLSGPIMWQSQAMPVAVSVGFACYGLHSREIFALIDYADFAMYQAKQAGKNRYVVFDPDLYARRSVGGCHRTGAKEKKGCLVGSEGMGE